jgi:hypothetical protein
MERGGGSLLSQKPDSNGLDWQERTNIAVQLIDDSKEDHIYDLGSGECRLSKLIKSKTYYAFDTDNFSIYDDINVVLIDLIEDFPIIKEKNSIAICLGFIDHIVYQNNFDNFMINLSKSFNKVIFSSMAKHEEEIVKVFKKYFKNVELVGRTKVRPINQGVYKATK